MKPGELFYDLKADHKENHEVFKAKALQQWQKQAAGCRRCALREGCRQVVFGEGPPEAQLMLVGEGPGSEEDKLGRPFVGRAGKLLDSLLEESGFSRQEVYIANVVKCRPPHNRNPLSEEIKACLFHLQGQIKIIDPKIIVCLGAMASKTLIDPKAQITKIRGKWVEREGFRIMPTLHPAYLLRDPQKKKLVQQDFQEVEREYKGLVL
ncbi:MAG: uracil-DNA glycosylase [Candidatus Contubernalis sp.]|nr:uracil-DNA glycosylase [Candidatus Contubernalis sp.]